MPTATDLAREALHRKATNDPIAPLNLSEVARLTRLDRENERWRRISGMGRRTACTMSTGPFNQPLLMKPWLWRSAGSEKRTREIVGGTSALPRQSC